MADTNHPHRLPLEPDHIDLTRPAEVRYWMRRLRASAEQLSRAVLVVGPNPTDVERYLQTPEGRGYPAHGASGRHDGAPDDRSEGG
jgi:hypothetical protein